MVVKKNKTPDFPSHPHSAKLTTRGSCRPGSPQTAGVAIPNIFHCISLPLTGLNLNLESRAHRTTSDNEKRFRRHEKAAGEGVHSLSSSSANLKPMQARPPPINDILRDTCQKLGTDRWVAGLTSASTIQESSPLQPTRVALQATSLVSIQVHQDPKCPGWCWTTAVKGRPWCLSALRPRASLNRLCREVAERKGGPRLHAC